MSAEKPDAADAAVEIAGHWISHTGLGPKHEIAQMAQWIVQWSATVAAAVRQASAVHPTAWKQATKETEQAVRSALQQNRGG